MSRHATWNKPRSATLVFRFISRNWRFHCKRHTLLRTLPDPCQDSPGSFFAVLVCHGGKRFCLLLGQFLVSSFGFTAFVTFAAKNPTPSLTHSKRPNSSGHWRTRCKPNPPLSKIIHRSSRYSRLPLPSIG